MALLRLHQQCVAIADSTYDSYYTYDYVMPSGFMFQVTMNDQKQEWAKVQAFQNSVSTLLPSGV